MPVRINIIFLFCCLVLCPPISHAQWVRCSGLSGGSIICFTFHDNIVFAGTEGGVYTSTNKGTSWTFSGLPGRTITALAVTDSNICAGTDSGNFISSDNGGNWKPVGPYPHFSLASIRVDNYPDTFSVDCNRDLFHGLYPEVRSVPKYSLDAFLESHGNLGLWDDFKEGLYHVKSLVVKNDTIFASMGNWLLPSVYLSTDVGKSWELLLWDCEEEHNRSNATIDDSVFAETYNGILCSTDKGTVWSLVDTQLGRVNALAVIGNYLFAGAHDGIYASTDRGTAWIWTPVCLTGTRVLSLVAYNNILYAGTENKGAYVSTNCGLTWAHSDTGLMNTFITSIAVKGDTILAGTGGNGVFISKNNGNDWRSSNAGLSNGPIGNVIILGNSFLVEDSGAIFRSTDGGNSWISVRADISGKVLSITSCKTFLYAKADNFQLYQSTDSGDSWKNITSNIPEPNPTMVMAVDTTLFVVAGYPECLIRAYGLPGSPEGIFRSTDQAVSWNRIYACPNSFDNQLRLLSFRNNIYMSFHADTIFRSTDNGDTWTATHTNLHDALLDIVGVSDGCLFGIDFSDRAYFSTDNGEKWTDVHFTLSMYNVSVLAAGRKDLFVGTLRNGLWRRPLSELGPPIK